MVGCSQTRTHRPAGVTSQWLHHHSRVHDQNGMLLQLQQSPLSYMSLKPVSWSRITHWKLLEENNGEDLQWLYLATRESFSKRDIRVRESIPSFELQGKGAPVSRHPAGDSDEAAIVSPLLWGNIHCSWSFLQLWVKKKKKCKFSIIHHRSWGIYRKYPKHRSQI